jgi:CMP-N,N'-diacetyllegionaminic acid synthase
MYKNKNFLAIIPARGGSKRLPRKNILNLNGKPLIRWSIEAGLKSKYIDKVVVTSDDAEILGIAESSGVSVINRPVELASDTSTTFDAIKHTINNVNNYDYIVLLQPTSPLRTAQHIDEAIEILFERSADAVVSVCEVDHSPFWSNTLPNNDNMSNFIRDDVLNKRSQDLEVYYRLNGAIYICDVNRLLQEERFLLKENIFAYKMDKSVSIDIDEEIDLKIAQALF